MIMSDQSRSWEGPQGQRSAGYNEQEMGWEAQPARGFRKLFHYVEYLIKFLIQSLLNIVGFNTATPAHSSKCGN